MTDMKPKVLLSSIKPHWKIRLLSLIFFNQNAEKIIKLRWDKGRIIQQDDSKFCFRSSGLKDIGEGEIEFYGVADDVVG
jgi:hypothetical protein